MCVTMSDIESALNDIARIRDQLAASTRFQGFAPPIVALTGGLAALLAGWQAAQRESDLLVWILLAAICALMIGTEAIIRGRRVHRSMADRLLNTTLQRFMPTAMAGAILGAVVLMRAPDFARFLPGLWQLQIAVGVFAVQGNLPRSMAWAGAFYFASGTAALLLAGNPEIPTPWLMGVPFALGQVLAAAILHRAAREPANA
jgi:hypothetical protein